MKNISRLVISMMLIFALALAFSACGGETAPAKDYDVTAIANSIATNVPFEDEYLSPVADIAFELNRIGVSLDSVAENNGAKEAAAYVSGAYPEMIVCIKTVDDNAAKTALTAVQSLITNYINNYANYGPEQVSKLESAVKVVRGQYVFVIVSNDNAQASSYLEGLLG